MFENTIAISKKKKNTIPIQGAMHLIGRSTPVTAR